MKEEYPLGAIADFLEQLPNDEYEHKRIGKMIRALEAAEARLALLESVLAEAKRECIMTPLCFTQHAALKEKSE